jgi:hypothetical protein
MEEALDPADRAEAKAEVDRALAGYALTHLTPLAVPDVYNTPEMARLRESVLLARLAHYHRLNTVVRADAVVSQSDREKFRRENGPAVMEPFRLSARYIQIAATGTDTVRGTTTDQPESVSAETRLNAIRRDIAAGKISFPAAARRYSDAPSRSRGGEIPPFRPGELFSLFEEHALKLEPGQMSPVFPGPGGFYLIQLIRRLPARDYERGENLERRERALDLLDRQLDRRVWASAYDAELRRIQARTPIVDHMMEYHDRAPRERIGQAGKFLLNRAQFDELFPRMPGTGLSLTDTQRVILVRSILLGAAMRQAHEREFKADIQLLANTNELAMVRRAANRLGFEAALASQLESTHAPGEVARFYQRNPRLFTPVTPARVVRLRLVITDPGLVTTADAARELASVISALRAGRTPVGAQPPGPPEYYTPPGVMEDMQLFGNLDLATATAEEIAAALGQATGLPDATTATAPVLPFGAPPSRERPTTGTVSGDDFTTPSATSAGDDGTTPSASGDDQPTSPTESMGGGAPAPASGGLPPSQRLPDFTASLPDKPRRPAKPVRAVTLAAKYQSPIYRLVVDDLGWQVLEDRADVPERVRGLAPGTYTAPRQTTFGAEAWHLAERLQAQPLPLEQVSRQAADALTGAKFRTLLAAELRRASKTSGIGKVSDPATPVPPRAVLRDDGRTNRARRP